MPWRGSKRWVVPAPGIFDVLHADQLRKNRVRRTTVFSPSLFWSTSFFDQLTGGHTSTKLVSTYVRGNMISVIFDKHLSVSCLGDP